MITLLIPFLWVACAQEPVLTETALKSYVADPDHGLVKEKQVGDYHIRLEYYPTDLLLARELRARPEAATATVEKLEKKYDSYNYYMLHLSKGGNSVLYGTPNAFGQFGELLQSLSFRMNQYVQLITDHQDTIPVGDFMFQRTYGTSPASSVLFAFNKEKIKDCEQLCFHLREFGLGTGKQVFHFQTRDLRAIPKIVFREEQPTIRASLYTSTNYNE